MMTTSRRAFLASLAGSFAASLAPAQARRPNVVLILADDLGYGDVGVYGSAIPTPNLDSMAADGLRFTDFYSASPVCSPSRAALLTGRYSTRVNVPLVVGPGEPGLPATEVTIAQMLRTAGYREPACIGKWHLGSTATSLPTARGFDEYFGITCSADMWPRPLLRNTEVIEETAQLPTLTQRFTQEAVDFIGRAKDQPFFLYLAHTAPHLPLVASAEFAGKSDLGAYGDVVRELDAGVGRVLEALRQHKLDSNTLVVFTSDNGPWWQGSPGRFRGRKGETYEGGMRVPFIARYPGAVPTGSVTSAMATGLDLLPTLASLCGAPLPANPIDGVDIWPLLTGAREDVERDAFLYFDSVYLQCARMGRWKLHVSRYNTEAWSPAPAQGRRNLPLARPELYDLARDPQESYDCAAANPQVVAQIRQRIDRLISTFPEGIVDAWRNTMRTRVLDESPADGLPLPGEP